MLVQSLTEFNEPPIFPIGLSYIAAYLPQEEVSIFDMNTAKKPFEELGNELKDVNPGVVGISLRNIKIAKPGEHHSALALYEETIKIIKRTLTDVVLIVGGSAFSLYAEELMKRLPEIDLGIFGEGEQSLPEILKNLNQPKSVKNVFYRKNGKIFFTGYRDWISSGKIRTPNRDLFDMKKYIDIPFSIGVQTKRGCILKCIHCSDRYLTGDKIRLRDPVLIVNEIEQLVKNTGIKTFSFVDNVFNIPLSHAQEICNEIIRRRLSVKWTAWFNEKYISEDFLNTTKEAGCAHLSFSPDSASDKVLKKLKKNFTTRELSRTYKLAKKTGIKAEYSFMINSPGESIFTLIKTLLFIMKAILVLKRNMVFHNLLMTTPIRIYPHTEIKELAVREGIIDKDVDLTKPVFYNPAPLKYIVNIIGLWSRLIWWLRRKIRRGVTA